MIGPAYPAARIVAPKVEAHFARHIAEARQRGQTGVATAPDADTIEALISVAFWASIRRKKTEDKEYKDVHNRLMSVYPEGIYEPVVCAVPASP